MSTVDEKKTTDTAMSTRESTEKSVGESVTVPLNRGWWDKHGGAVIIWGGRLVFVVVLLAAWQLCAGRLFDVTFTSRPLDVMRRLAEWHRDGLLWSNTWVTLQEVMLGFAFGAGSGALAGFVLASLPTFYRVVDPFIVALYSLPKVALAPLFIVWFGIGLQMKVVLAAVTVFFLVFLNTAVGVREVDRGLIDAVRLMGGRRRDVVWKVVLPGSMTGLLTGLKVAVPYSLIGAVIGELVASNRGLGYLISDAAANYDTAGVFATLAVLGTIATVLNLVVGVLDRRANRWKPLEGRA
ncbi:ABC transporter permease [Streptomyces sp. NBC_01451]|uniref:ABC transporter permease n=1 Tax=Streptomyces sp. NBC_01451 TaxID=2903872 RepID=UPI002E335703|nr:ABC transporter permease [Streptomyces sp. NBC_01451]